jgi:ATP:corrinoid adenosyltransferase
VSSSGSGWHVCITTRRSSVRETIKRLFCDATVDEAENDQVTKTGLGQTWEMLRNKALSAAVLDECTSAVSIDAEEVLYAEAAKQGVTTITISQRNTLPEFHTQHLSLGEDTASGCGGTTTPFLAQKSHFRIEKTTR